MAGRAAAQAAELLRRQAQLTGYLQERRRVEVLFSDGQRPFVPR